MIRFYWPQTWLVIVPYGILAAALLENQAASYNGYFSIGWFLGLTMFFWTVSALVQMILWLLDVWKEEASS